MFIGGWLWIQNNRLRRQANELQAKREELLKRESESQQRENQSQGNSNQNSANEMTEKEREDAEQKQKEEQLRQEQIAAQNKNSKPPIDTNQNANSRLKPNVASFILIAPLRGSNQLPKISIPPKTDFLSLRLQLESNEYPSIKNTIY